MNSQYLIDFDLSKIPVSRSDVLVIGGGIAGLTVAVTVAGELKTRVLAKGNVEQTSTWFAQGGIAVSLAPGDSPERHYKDTMAAGGGLCDPEAVKVLVEEAAPAVSMLTDMGAEFDKVNGSFHFVREGGHSVARVVHAGDATGNVVSASLVAAAKSRKNIHFTPDTFVLDILESEGRCCGVLAYEQKTGQVEAYLASAVVLAAGGMGQIYDVTTNPLVASGDGLAMAERRGVKLAGLEFIQFHPTTLDTKENPRFLISEAIRGEGAYLVNKDGQRFMTDLHPLGELAPRDIVSRAVVDVMEADKADHVFIDARHIGEEKLKKRFPSIWDHCLKAGYDMSKELIPVNPAAHYLIGGIVTDLYGRTSLDGLFASGEVASTGVHGANRLASNSLLEGLVFSRRVGRYLLDNLKAGANVDDVRLRSVANRQAGKSLVSARESLRKMMSEKTGVIRTSEGLKAAAATLKDESQLLDYEYNNPHDWETINMITLARLIVSGALARRQSLGVHLVGS
ncbi:MAG: L-aspartate oxidase [Actinomycetia bacterium]|nr:L-aspartate oxidase [Actinomycetes bacterium]